MTAVKRTLSRFDGAPDLSSVARPPLETRIQQVLVYECADRFEDLAATLRQLNCLPVQAADLAGRAAAEGAPSAALISADLDDPIAICAALPPSLPKIIVASDASFAFRCAATRAGVDAIVKRPVDLDELFEWLDHFAKRQAFEAISVVLVDDHALTAEIHAAVLERAGMTVRIVGEAAHALRVIEDVSPDLILMDVEMPEVNGIELAKIIRQSREHLAIPIVFLSSEGDERRQMVARESGGDDFIQKPVDPRRLASLVRLRASRARTLRALIERDSLTGLLNHGRFQDRIVTELQRSARSGAGLSLAILDLDNFKTINDRYGHPAGDKVIRTLSRMMLNRFRAGDVLGRCGGEEFGILLPDTRADTAHAMIDGLRLRFGEVAFKEPAGPFTVTLSAGVAGSEGKDLQRLVRAADEALYNAKRSGRNCVDRSP